MTMTQKRTSAMQTPPATVLVIEKHPLMRAAIVNAISDEPELTIGAIAANGQDILQIVETLHPGIILYAIGNPGEDDLETMRELHERLPGSALLVLTTAEVPEQEKVALEHGADVVLPKTIQRAELLHALRIIKANMDYREEATLIDKGVIKAKTTKPSAIHSTLG